MSLCFIKPRGASGPDSEGLSLWVGVNSYLVNEIQPFKAVDWEVTTELWGAVSMLGYGSSQPCPAFFDKGSCFRLGSVLGCGNSTSPSCGKGRSSQMKCWGIGINWLPHLESLCREGVVNIWE